MTNTRKFNSFLDNNNNNNLSYRMRHYRSRSRSSSRVKWEVRDGRVLPRVLSSKFSQGVRHIFMETRNIKVETANVSSPPLFSPVYSLRFRNLAGKKQAERKERVSNREDGGTDVLTVLYRCKSLFAGIYVRAKRVLAAARRRNTIMR